MTHALTLPAPPPRPARLTLDEATWDEIANAYLAGATAPELARCYRISVGTLHRHFKKRGAGKRSPGATAFARAHAAAMMAEDDARRRRRVDAETLHDLADHEPHDPAVLARIAATASGNAMLETRLGEAKALADLAVTYGRAAAQRPTSFRMMIVRAIFDPLWADVFFGDGPHGARMENEVKSAYWSRRNAQLQTERERENALAHAKARVAKLEARLRELGVEG